MKKISVLISIFVLLTAFTCENEPLEGDFQTDPPDENTACDTAIQNSADAATAFEGATDSNYMSLCVAYKAAIQAQIGACGDTDGLLQAVSDSLGDCSNDNPPADCESIALAVQLAAVELENASSEFYTELCNAYKTLLLLQIDACGDEDGSLQTIADDLGDCLN